MDDAMRLFRHVTCCTMFVILAVCLSGVLNFGSFRSDVVSNLFSKKLCLLPVFANTCTSGVNFQGSVVVTFSLLSVKCLNLKLLPALLRTTNLIRCNRAAHFSKLPSDGSH